MPRHRNSIREALLAITKKGMSPTMVDFADNAIQMLQDQERGIDHYPNRDHREWLEEKMKAQPRFSAEVMYIFDNA
jgi:hypothetical protein